MIFPKTFALGVRSTGKLIGVDESAPHNLHSQSTATNDFWQTFQVLYFPELSGDARMLVCFRSLGNGKYLSARDQVNSGLHARAESSNCGQTEQFELHTGPTNTISLRSRLNQKFLGTCDGVSKPFAFECDQFFGLEIKKVFDKSRFPRVSFR
jgi:hypothetical protein